MRRESRALVIAALAVALVAVAVAWYISLSGPYREAPVVGVAYAPSVAGAPSTVTFTLAAGATPPLAGQSVSLWRFAPAAGAAAPGSFAAQLLGAMTAGPLGYPLAVAGSTAGPPPAATATSPPTAGLANLVAPAAFAVGGSGILRISTAA